MDELSLAHWLLFTVVPLGVTLASFWGKVSKEKTETENRFTKVEGKVKEQEKHIEEIKADIKQQREDLKLLPELKGQGEMIMKMVENIQNDLKQNRD